MSLGPFFRIEKPQKILVSISFFFSLVKAIRVFKLLSDNLAYAWKPIQFSQGAMYLYTNTNMTCRFITDGVHLYTNNENMEVTGGEK